MPLGPAKGNWVDLSFSYNMLKFFSGVHIDNSKRLVHYFRRIRGVREEMLPFLEELVLKNQAGLGGLDDILDEPGLGTVEMAYNLTATALAAQRDNGNAACYERALVLHDREFYALAGTMATIREHLKVFERSSNARTRAICEASIMNDRAFHIRTSIAFLPVVKPDARPGDIDRLGELLVQLRSMELVLKDLMHDLRKDIKNRSLNCLLEFAMKYHSRRAVTDGVRMVCDELERRFDRVRTGWGAREYAEAVALAREDMAATRESVNEALDELERDHLLWLNIKVVHILHNLQKRLRG